MTDRVVLVNSLFGADDFSPGNQHLGLLTIKEGLRTAGFNDVLLLPDKKTDAISGLETMLGSLKKTGTGQNTLFGITVMTECYSNFVSISGMIRKLFPKSAIIGGGPHFQREPWNEYDDPVKAALKEGLVDAVGVKHGKSIVDLITEHNGDLAAASKIPGLYALDSSGQVSGHGFGRYPKVGRLPYITYERPMTHSFIHVVQTVIDDSCSNLCDFCSINKSSMTPKELAKKTLEEAFSQSKEGFLVLQDSNPFERGKLGFYREVFGGLGKKNEKILKSGFAHPALFADEAYLPELSEFLFENNFRKIFVGRECFSEEFARIIGSRYNNKLKSQGQLDAEKAGIEQFIDKLEQNNNVRASRGLSPRHYEIKISYIVTPYGTKESYLQISSEMEHFHNMSSAYLMVVPIYFILAPFPGTMMKRRLLEDITHPESFEEHSFRGNSWKNSLPGSRLLNELVRLERLYFSGSFNGMQHHLLKKAVDIAYS
jgi:hypothetical protein